MKPKFDARKQTKLLQEVILRIFHVQKPPLTMRQVYYTLTVLKLIDKTEDGYKQACHQLKIMCKKELLPYVWIADNLRWPIKPECYAHVSQGLLTLKNAYRRNLWSKQSIHVEVWVEKNSLANVISPVMKEYDVPLYVARGDSSISALCKAAQALLVIDKPIFIYHFGDFDPSGVDATYHIREGLRQYGAEIMFERAAVTPEQIEGWNLPSRPTKQSDPQAKKGGNEPNVELDAIPADKLRELVKERLQYHLDPETLAQTLEKELQDRKKLEKIFTNLEPDPISFQEGNA